MSGCPITVILSSFNRPEGLRRSFESVQRQTIRDRLEVIVCDDGSPNGEVHLLLDEYEKVPGVQVIRGEPRPVAHKKMYCTFTELINRAMDCASGLYFSYLTDGNEYTPHACERNAEHLDEMADVFLVWGMVQNIKNGERIPMPQFGRLTPEYVANMLPKNNFIDHSSVMHRWTDARWSTSPQSWMYADWLYWRELLERKHIFMNHRHHCLDFYLDKDSFGRCLIREGMSFEETMRLKMQKSDGTKPVKVTKEENMERKVKYARNAGGKIEIVDGQAVGPDELVLLDKVMTPAGNLFPAFVPFGEVGEYVPKKPVKPKMPDEAQKVGLKTPFAGMEKTVEAARKRVEKMKAKKQAPPPAPEPVPVAVEVVVDDQKAAEQLEAAVQAKKPAKAAKKPARKTVKKPGKKRR